MNPLFSRPDSSKAQGIDLSWDVGRAELSRCQRPRFRHSAAFCGSRRAAALRVDQPAAASTRESTDYPIDRPDLGNLASPAPLRTIQRVTFTDNLIDRRRGTRPGSRVTTHGTRRRPASQRAGERLSSRPSTQFTPHPCAECLSNGCSSLQVRGRPGHRAPGLQERA